MSRVVVPRRMYLVEDRSRAVPEGDPEARHLLCPAGGELSRADAERYGLLDEPEVAPEPEVEAAAPAAKARTAPANKARARAGDK